MAWLIRDRVLSASVYDTKALGARVSVRDKIISFSFW